MRIPIASDAWRFIIPSLTAGIICLAVGIPVLFGFGVLCILFAIACAGFFRDFNRNTPIDDKIIYSPADGTVVDVSVVAEGPQKGERIIRIFLSVLDGHVQRSPVTGKVKELVYKKGLFLDARHLEAHIRNEQSAMTIETPRGTIIVTQIAGLIARRIVCWVKQGMQLQQGDRYGLIRFGSQVDVFMPMSTETAVNVGDKVFGGTTVLARWKV